MPEVFMGYCRALLTVVLAAALQDAAGALRILTTGTSKATGLLAGWIEADLNRLARTAAVSRLLPV